MKATTKVMSVLGLLTLAGAAQAEVVGSMGIASSYLWRGIDLGSGTPAVSGDLKYTAGGFYTGVWASSGDTGWGTEYDLYAGWGGQLGPVNLDVSYWTYAYPTYRPGPDPVAPFDLSDFVVNVGFGPVTAFVYIHATDFREAPAYSPAFKDSEGAVTYFGVKAKFGAFTGLVGKHTEDAQNDELLHLDLSYAYNDNLSFTVSAPLDTESGNKPDPMVVVAYSVPFGK